MPKYLKALAKTMEISVDDLIHGRYRAPDEQQLQTYSDAPDHARAFEKDAVMIGQFDMAGIRGGQLVLRDQPGVMRRWEVNREWLNKNLSNISDPEKLALLTGFGDSMRPMFNPGDPLLVDTGVTTCDYDGVYFFRVNHEGHIKRLQRIPIAGGATVLRAKSDNLRYDPFDITHGMDFQFLARVVKAWCGESY